MSDPAVNISHLTKDFRIGIRGVRLRAVDDLSLTVHDNEVFGLLGPNGSGKSTTLKVILGLLEPTHGDCTIFGHRSDSIKARALVGFLPEAPYFYRYLSGRELLRFYAQVCGVAADTMEKRIDDVLDLVDMKAAASRRVGTYSKGMLQRIGVAQALVHDPRLVILDEPTAGVDPIGSEAIAQIIRELKQRGKTVLLCSHLLAQVEGVCDRVAIMNRGRLEVAGEVKSLLRKQERDALIVESLKPEALEEVRAVLQRHGAKLCEVQHPSISLDQLFLEKVRRNDDGVGSPEVQA